MKISIVIPLYNKQNFIRRCLNSILNQSYSNYEIIIVDDGSEDLGPDIIVNEYKLSNLTLLRQLNSGVSIARNRGVSEADGQWVAFLDADDYWHENFLLEIYKTIKIFPNISLCSTGYQFQIGNNIKKAKLFVSGKGEYRVIDNYFLSSCRGALPITASTVAIKREVFQNIGGFPENWKMGEDIYLWMKIAINFKLGICLKVLATYDHSDQDSATKKNPVLDILPHVKSLEVWLVNDKIPKRLRGSAEELLHRSYIYTALQNIKYGNKYKAIKLASSSNVTRIRHKLLIKTLALLPYWFITYLTKRY